MPYSATDRFLLNRSITSPSYFSMITVKWLEKYAKIRTLLKLDIPIRCPLYPLSIATLRFCSSANPRYSYLPRRPPLATIHPRRAHIRHSAAASSTNAPPDLYTWRVAAIMSRSLRRGIAPRTAAALRSIIDRRHVPGLF